MCTAELGLKPGEPIHDICGLLESAGVKVMSIPYASNDFFGLCIGHKDGGPAVVVNVWEKIRSNVEFIVLRMNSASSDASPKQLDVDRTDEDKLEEGEANLFGGHFLMPDEGFIKEWNSASVFPRLIVFSK